MLHVAPGLALPIDYVTKTAAIFAQRRKGKTYLASVLAEELVDAGLPWVALDPTGAWWGLRANADGKTVGLPVVVLGGLHGDVPLEATAGKIVAELVVNHPGWYVLDMSQMQSKADERRFAAEFGEHLYRLKGRAGHDFALHLFVDEADMFVPQDRERGDLPVLGAFQSIVRRGGLRGIGTTLISQRPALVNKSVLVQLDILMLLRLVAGNDQDYVDKNYISRQASKETQRELMDSLASLAIGEGWVWEPGAEPPLLARVQVRERRTFNSSATPKPGEKRIEPARLADIDLADVQEAMAESIEKAEANDPSKLHARIRRLEAELAARVADVVTETVEVEVPVIPADLVGQLEDLVPEIAAAFDQAEAAASEAVTVGYDNLQDMVRTKIAALTDSVRQARPGGRGVPPHGRPAAAAAPPARTSTPPNIDPAVAQTSMRANADTRILLVLAQHGPRTQKQLCLQAGISARSSTLSASLSKLRKAGYVNQGQPISITDAGRASLGSDLPPPLPTGGALLDYWRGQLGPNGADRRIFDALVCAWPNPMGKDELCAVAGISTESSTLSASLSKLRRLGIVEGWKVPDDLMRSAA